MISRNENAGGPSHTGMLRHLSFIVGLAACSSLSEPTEVQSSVSTQALADSCPPEWCAGNSPQIAYQGAYHGLWELNLDHQPNGQGIVFLGISRFFSVLRGNGVPPRVLDRVFNLEVKDSSFKASYGSTQLTGQDLQGFTLWLEQGAPPQQQQYAVRIFAVGSVNELVAPHNEIKTYKLVWGTVQGQGVPEVMHAGDLVFEPVIAWNDAPLCNVWDGQIALSAQTNNPAMSHDGRPSPPSDSRWDESLAWDESTVVPPFNAVVFEGDRINATTRTVQPTPDDRWFNIGCPRHTLAKMRLTRNTLHTTTGGWQQVQATLKMLSADYCGTGTALTVIGTPIVWQQNPPGAAMTYRFPPLSGNLEARWNENGAICLNTPRLREHPNSDVKDSLGGHCAAVAMGWLNFPPWLPRPSLFLPSCADPEPLDPGSERIISANWDPAP